MRCSVDDVVVARSLSRPVGFRRDGRGALPAFVAAAALVAFVATAAAQTDPCVVEDDGSGTVVLPPKGCPYLSPDQFHEILDGLPAGVTVQMGAIHRDFICERSGLPQELCNQPGGTLGGELELFQSTLELTIDSTDPATLPLHRVLLLPVSCRVDTGPRNLGDPVQVFPNEMVQLQGSIFGDPDFDVLTITAGSGNGLPSPGQTTLTQLSGGKWQVDSFFDITYRIDYQGSTGGALNGASGSTTGTIRMEARAEPESTPCDPAIDGGPHWLDNTIEAVDYIPTEAQVAIDLGPDGTVDTNLVLRGPMRVRRGAPDTSASPHTVQTEILSMDLTGGGSGQVTLTAGVGLGSNGTLPPSPGALTEQATDPAQVDSFFDVFTELSLADGTTLHNNDPLRVVAIIDCVPPRVVFTNTAPVDLFDDFGVLVGRLITIQHVTFPPPPPDDHLTIDPTFVRFGAAGGGAIPAIPSDFFDPGSDPFEGEVSLEGASSGPSVRLQRSDDPVKPADPSGTQGTVDTEIVALSLRSVQPITVTYVMAPPEQWDVTVSNLGSAGEGGVTPGSLTATKTHQNGGTYSAGFKLCPVLTFARLNDGAVRVLDLCPTFPPDPLEPLDLNISGVFVHSVDPDLGVIVATGAQWVPGIEHEDIGVVQAIVPSTASTKDLPPHSIDHTVTPPVEFCPTAAPGDPLDPCFGLQKTDCNGQLTDTCLPRQVEWRQADGRFVATLCDCYTPGPGCGPVFIAGGGDTVTCGGGSCTAPDVDPCEVYVNGNPYNGTGFVDGDVITCECASPGCTGPADCFDGNPCTDDVCNADGSCSNPNSPAGQPCDDGIFCNGSESCDGNGNCVSGLPPSCDDGNACTDDVCDSASDACINTPVANNTPCPDGVFCNGDETCQNGVCQSGTPPTCDDGDICTFDICDSDLDQCTNPPDPICDTCGPNPDGTSCLSVICPVPPDNDSCQPKCVVHNATTGVTTVIACECSGPNDCHVDLGTTAGARLPGGDPCVVPDDAGGTVTLPPIGCDYLSADEVHMIIDGLGGSATIELAAIHKDFICGQGIDAPAICSAALGNVCEDVGGSLGGNVDCFRSTLEMQVTGTGNLAGFSRTLFPSVETEVHTALRNPGDAVQDFDTDMFRLQGQLFGDPDFCTFTVTAGTDFGLPSPGHTTLRQLPGGSFAVDSFFDITYQIQFAGCPGSMIEGLSGTTTGTIRMGTGSMPTCTGGCPAGEVCNESVTDLGNGDYQICCDCVPDVTGACCMPSSPFCTVTTVSDCAAQGGTYLGDNSACGGSVEACCLGDGNCGDNDSVCCVAFSGTPQGPGTDCASTDCPLPTCEPSADGTTCQPDACSPVPEDRCLATCVNVDPTTGAVTIRQCDCLTGGDLGECHVDLPPAVGGRTLRDPTSPCVVVDDGSGTVTLPPSGCEYLSADEVHMIIDGLPADTQIELAPIHKNFICERDNPVCSPLVDPNECEQPGGTLGGSTDCTFTRLEMAMRVVGPSLPALTDRTLTFDPVFMEVHTGPRNPGDPVQDFPTEIFRLQGSLFGDPDFCTLTITAGSDNGLPSPGHTTLTRLAGGNWTVDSFFDITYRIDFVGCPGGALDGMSGSTTGTIRMQTGTAPGCAGQCAPGTRCMEKRKPQADGTIDYCCKCVPARPVVADELAVPRALTWPPSARATTCMSDADCTQEASCIPDETGAFPGICYVPKNRYLTVAGNTTVTTPTARRLSVVLSQRWCNGAVGGTACTKDSQCGPATCNDVAISCTADAQCNAVAAGSVCSSTNVCVQRLGWFGAPDAMGYARVVDEASRYYTVWGGEQFPIDCGVDGLCPTNAHCDVGLGSSNTCRWDSDNTEVMWSFVFLGDCQISPMIRDVRPASAGGSEENKAERYYLVESVFQGDDVSDENSYSVPLKLPTVRVWTDETGGVAAGILKPPEGSPGFLDILGQVGRFKDKGQAHMAWFDIHPQAPDHATGFLDMLESVNGFKDLPYSFDDPCTCSGLTPCP